MSLRVVATSAAFAAGAATSSTSTPVTLAVGDTNVVIFRSVNSGPLTVTDTALNTYAEAAQTQTGTSTLSVWYATTTNGHAANVVTVTHASATGRSLLTVELGSTIGFPLDRVAIAPITTTTTPVSPAFSTTVAPELILISGDQDVTGHPWSAASSYTLAVQDASNVVGAAYKVVNTIQSGITASIVSTDATNQKVAIVTTFIGGRLPIVGGSLQVDPLVRERTIPLPILPGNARQAIGRIELQLAGGAGLYGSTTMAPVWMGAMSFDHGHTYGTWRQFSAGPEGAYSVRAYANAWGTGRFPVLKLRCSDPFNSILTDVFVTMEPQQG